MSWSRTSGHLKSRTELLLAGVTVGNWATPQGGLGTTQTSTSGHPQRSPSHLPQHLRPHKLTPDAHLSLVVSRMFHDLQCAQLLQGFLLTHLCCHGNCGKPTSDISVHVSQAGNLGLVNRRVGTGSGHVTPLAWLWWLV